MAAKRSVSAVVWSPYFKYENGDVVSVAGKTYISLRDENASYPPDNPTEWKEAEASPSSVPPSFRQIGSSSEQAENRAPQSPLQQAVKEKARGIVPTWEIFFEAGSAALEASDYDRAIRSFGKSIDSLSGLVRKYKDAGRMWANRNHAEEAKECVVQAVILNLLLPDAYLKRGLAWAGKGRHSKAIKDFTKAIEIDSNCVEAYRSRASAWNAIGKPEKGRSDEFTAVDIEHRTSKGSGDNEAKPQDRETSGIPGPPLGNAEWMANRKYKVSDIVSFEGRAFRSLRSGNGVSPAENLASWEEVQPLSSSARGDSMADKGGTLIESEADYRHHSSDSLNIEEMSREYKVWRRKTIASTSLKVCVTVGAIIAAIIIVVHQTRGEREMAAELTKGMQEAQARQEEAALIRDIFRVAQFGKPEQVQASIANGAKVNDKDDNDITPLTWAAEKNQSPEVITILLKAGARVDDRDKDGQTPLAHAAHGNPNPEVTTILLKAGAKVGDRDKTGMTPLMWAAGTNPNPDVITILLRAGAKVGDRDKTGMTPLLWASVLNSNPEIIRTLLKAGAKLVDRNTSGGTPLMIAAQSNLNPDVITILHRAGARVGDRDKTGMTPLMWAASTNPNPEVATMLLAAGANLEERNRYGQTPLMLAARTNPFPAVVMALLKAGAKVDARANDGTTSLMYASGFNRDPWVVTTLLQAGANVKLKNAKGKTALDFAARNSDLKGTPAYEALVAASGETSMAH